MTEKLSKRGVEMTCSTCHNKGHNKRSCPLNSSSTRTSVASSSAAPSTSKRRGRPKGSTKAAAGRGKESPAATAATVGVDRGKEIATCVVDRAIGRGRETGTAVVGGVGRGRGDGATVFYKAGRGRGAGAAFFGGTGRGRGAGAAVVGGVGRGRATGAVVVGETGRGRGAGALDCTGISRGDGVTGANKGREIAYKRPRMPGMPMNSTIVTRNLGYHKPTSGVKWKGKKAVTQQGLEDIRAQKMMRTSYDCTNLTCFENNDAVVTVFLANVFVKISATVTAFF
ncbi:damage suppressor protein-like [Capsicum annuum]|uniref:damage suppressor protein-like n=1 Tax=Capsicum annuum TaxID=4072 RepID=UPI001FB0C4AD|nr:damage suppressor protein-like [Capsicum annuum]